MSLDRYLAPLTFFGFALLAGCTGGGSGGSGSTAGASIASTTSRTSPTSTSPVTTGSSSAPVASGSAGGFKVAASLAVPRGHHTATLLDDGRILVVGGLDLQSGSPSYVAESEVYDPVSNASTKTSDPALGGSPGGYMATMSGTKAIPVVRFQHSAVKLQDGRVLIVGGHGVEALDATGNPIEAELATAFTFDPKKNTFAQVGSLNFARSSASAVLLPSGKVLVMGGFNATLNTNMGGSTPTAEIFDPTTNMFTATTMQLGVPRQEAGAALVNGVPMIAGGLAFVVASGATTPAAYLAPGTETFDPTTGAFAPGPQPANDRADATLDAVSTTDVLLAGGGGAKGEVLAVERLTAGKWTTVAQLPAGREQHASAASSGDVLLVGGVSLDAAGKMTTLETADFFSGASSTVVSFPMAHQRNGCAAVALPSGAVVVLGGFENGKTDPLGLDGAAVGPVETFAKPSAGAPATPPPASQPAPNPSPAPTPAPTPAPLTYTKDVAPIMAAKCTSCHDGNIKFSLQTYAAVSNYVVPGDTQNSQLISAINGNMKSYCSPTEVNTLTTWVQQGAKQ